MNAYSFEQHADDKNKAQLGHTNIAVATHQRSTPFSYQNPLARAGALGGRVLPPKLFKTGQNWGNSEAEVAAKRGSGVTCGATSVMEHYSQRDEVFHPARARPADAMNQPVSAGKGLRTFAWSGALLLLAGTALRAFGQPGSHRGDGVRSGGDVSLAGSGWTGGIGLATLASGNGTWGNDTVGGGIDGCPKLPACKKYVVNSLFWTLVNTQEVLAVRDDEHGNQVAEPAGMITSVPFSFTADSEWHAPDGRLIASSHQDAMTAVTNIYVQDCTNQPISVVSEQCVPIPGIGPCTKQKDLDSPRAMPLL